MKKLILLTTIATALLSCNSNAGRKALIKGNISNLGSKKMIYLDQLSPTKTSIVDSALADDKGNFSFHYTVPQTGYYRLRADGKQSLNLILSPKDHITIHADAKNLIDSYTIKGSKVCARLLKYNHFIRHNYLKRDSINKFYESQAASPKIDSIKEALQAAYQVYYDQLEKKAVSVINENPGSFIALAAVQQLEHDKYVKLYEKVDSAFGKAHHDSPYFEPFDDKVSEMRKLAPGNPIPDIILPDTSGKTRKLSALKGHVVLVDFWASWCNPCRHENPNVVKLYKKYHDKGFEVFSVSLDGLQQQTNPKADWEKAIKEDGLIWPNQVSALKGWQSPVVALFKIQGIPYSVLIDKKGNIIAKGLRGEDLDDKVAQIFGE